MRTRRLRWLLIGVLTALALAIATSGLRRGGAAPATTWTSDARRDALQRAVLWRPPPVPLAEADLAAPAHGLPDDVSCTFRVTRVDGTARKFTCELPSGERLRVKYAGPEPHGEVAASRLLLAIGFGADRVGFVRRLRCRGCPRAPFATMAALTLVGAEGLYARMAPRDRIATFDWPSVEREFEGEQIRTADVEGWTFEELARLGSASRTHADALRLLAVFLAHWDNKAENQRLVCRDGGPDAQGRCARPFAMLQDVGATFGPRKVDLENWAAAPVWTDRARCEVGMEELPHGGATFVPVRISEEGRRWLAQALRSIARPQVEALFRGARFEPRYGQVQDWVRAFEDRVARIADGPPCPS